MKHGNARELDWELHLRMELVDGGVAEVVEVGMVVLVLDVEAEP